MDPTNDSFFMLFDLISLGCGMYILFTYVKLRMAGRLFPNTLLVPKDRSPKDCLDSEAYIRYIQPRLLIIGIFVTLFGLINFLNEFLHLYNYQIGLVLTGVALVALGWYAVCSGKANRKYF